MGLLDDIHGKEPTPAPGAPPAPERRPETRHGVQLELKEERVLLTAGESKAFPLIVRNTGTEPDVIRFKIDLLTESQEKGGAEWTVKFAGVDPKAWEPTFSKDFERELELISGGEREITMSVVCPPGARPGAPPNGLVHAPSPGLTPKPLVSGLQEGAIVEVVAGPFKGEKARVQKSDGAKEEITGEL